MRFAKWQALGNDYVIVERRQLTAAQVREICAPHTGVGADGVLVLCDSDDPDYVARLRIFNPDGSEAELSGNGAREAVLYLRREGWTDSDTFSIETAAGEIRPTITGPDTCRLDIGRARLESPDFPAGGPDGRGTLTAAGRDFDFQHVCVGNPQCAIEVGDELDTLDLAVYGPPIETHELFPNRTNVSFWRRDAPNEITARIFERGVGETLSSGTGASGAAVAATLRGVAAPVRVQLDGGELEVAVSAELRIELTGWARPVYSGSLSDDFTRALEAAR